MKCPTCGADLPDDVKFCCECGNKIEISAKRFCRECGKEFAEGDKFCTSCGAKIELDSEEEIRADDITPKAENIISSAVDAANEKITDFSIKLEEQVNDFAEKLSEMSVSTDKTANGNDKIKKRPIIAIAVVALLALILSIGGRTKSTDSAVTGGSKIEVINVIGQSYPDAMKALQEAGFTNITSNVGNVSDETLWIVTAQNVKSGRFIHANDEIKLTCAMKCKLYLDISSEYNLLFNKYDIAIFLDGKEIGSVSNGSEFTYFADILSGEHELVFCKSGNTSPKGTKNLVVSSDMTYLCELIHDKNSISMKDEKIENNAVNTEVIDEPAEYSDEDVTSYDVENTGVVNEPAEYSDEDATSYDVENTGVVDEPAEYSAENVTSYNTEKEESAVEETVAEEQVENSTVSYSTNDKESVKNGNSGVYAYRNRGGQYYIYYIIDFDEGYVYRFCEGNGDTICDRVKMESGTLNDVLIITYHDGGSSWSYGIHFNWKNQPDHLIVQDEDGFEWDYYTTDLDDALSLKDKKKICDY